MANHKALNRVEIIAALRCCGNTDTKRPDCEHCPLNGRMCVKRMLEGAAALLERDEQPNDPLTLEELRGMDGEPVWVTPGGFWALVHIAPAGVLLMENSGELANADGWMEHMGPIYRRKPEGGGEQNV